MRETVGSLRAYFIFVGIIGIITAVLSARLIIALLPMISQLPIITMLVLALSTVVDVVLSIMFVYTGMRLPKLLHTSPKFVLGLIYVLAAWIIISFLLSLLAKISVLAVVYLVVGLLIAWYLRKNVLRLSTLT